MHKDQVCPLECSESAFDVPLYRLSSLDQRLPATPVQSELVTLTHYWVYGCEMMSPLLNGKTTMNHFVFNIGRPPELILWPNRGTRGVLVGRNFAPQYLLLIDQWYFTRDEVYRNRPLDMYGNVCSNDSGGKTSKATYRYDIILDHSW